MAIFKDLTGLQFERLTVMKCVGKRKNRKHYWLCECSCGSGKEVIASTCNLTGGHVKSCGCYRDEKLYKASKKYNTYDLTNEFGIGYTFKDEPFYFDLEDYDLIKNYCWAINENGYLSTNNPERNPRKLKGHRVITNATQMDFVDHINHNRVDNRKSNLRLVTQSQNMMNMILSTSNTSGYKGVSFDKKNQKWVAQITTEGAIRHKRFFDIEDAIDCRKRWEEKYHGEYALKESLEYTIK